MGAQCDNEAVFIFSDIGQGEDIWIRTTNNTSPSTKMNLDQYDYIRFTWADLNGHPRGKTITKSCVKNAMEFGLGVGAGKFFTYNTLTTHQKN